MRHITTTIAALIVLLTIIVMLSLPSASPFDLPVADQIDWAIAHGSK